MRARACAHSEAAALQHTWTVVSISDGQALSAADPEWTLTFETDGTVRSQRYEVTADYHLDGTGSLYSTTIGGLAGGLWMTRRYLAALQDTWSSTIVSKELTFVSRAGAVVMTLHRS